MTRALEMQIIVYMIILATIAFMWGYSKGHREGASFGRRQAYKLIGKLASNPFNSDEVKWEYKDSNRAS